MWRSDVNPALTLGRLALTAHWGCRSAVPEPGKHPCQTRPIRNVSFGLPAERMSRRTAEYDELGDLDVHVV
jgi:hypothetical protein